ncbi:MAG: cysteine desulfurase [Candidatus Omnitrophica bacterium]|nr:cysteine desulfurase [Candidatus Omnitrophota bacterium]
MTLMIYLDYNATTPLYPEVRRAMAPFLEEAMGNASSLHEKGREARGAIEEARAEILQALGDPAGRLIFTSGGTEADNLALKGVVGALRGKGNRLVVSSIEHSAVYRTAQALAEEGVEVSFVPVDSNGILDLEALERAVTPGTLLVSVMQANNEVGTIQPIEAAARIAQEKGVLFHTDAVQSFGKVPLDVRKAQIDLVSVSAHKIGGPKGIGALYLRQGAPLKPLLHGGPHEQNLRAGTQAVPAIVGMGKAVEVTFKEMESGISSSLARKRDRLEAGLRACVPETLVNGDSLRRLSGTLNMSFPGCEAATLLMALDLNGICVSTGSACSSGSAEPSHVLQSMGFPAPRMTSSIRFSIGWGTTDEEIDEALVIIPPVVKRIREAALEVSG